jgi:serine/threonine-protein kinase
VRFAAVPSGRYVVRVSKDGFLPEPDQQIEVKKGQDQVVLVVLQSQPVSATLAVHTAPDAEVFLDGNVVGAASKEGTLSIPNVGFGNHSVEARRKGYRGSPVQVEVGPEASGLVALRLTRAPGVMEVRRNPANSVITYARAGDPAIHTLSGGRQELPEGTYHFVARANGYREKTATVEVAADETRTVDLTLTSVSTPAPAPTPAPAVKFANADWEGQGWTAVEEGWYVHKPAGFVKYKPGPIQGAITFTARWTRPGFLRGKGRLQWFVDYKDDKNYLLFELDDKGFEGFLIRNGKRTSRGKKESVKERPAYIINILLAPGRVTHRIQEDGKWRVLDDWAVSDSDVVSGRFGFLIQRGEVLMKDFQLSPGR